MPHPHGDILVVTKEELVPEYYTVKSLSVVLSRYKNKPYGIKRAQLGGNGRKLLVIYDSLPKKIQDKIEDPRKVNHVLERYYNYDNEAVRFYTTYKFPDTNDYLSEDAQDKHIINASVLKAVVLLEADRRTERLNKSGKVSGIPKTLWKDAMSFIEIKEKQNPETFQCTIPRSYRRFMDDALNPFKKESYAGIVKKYKSNTYAKKVRASKEEKLFNDLFTAQKHKPNYTDIAMQYEAFLRGYLEIVNSTTGELYEPKGYREVSAGTIYNYLKKWENAIGNEAKRSGDRQKLLGKFSPYHSFQRPQFAGSLLSIDDRQPPFEYEKGKRMWFYNGLDVASGCITVSVHGKTKEGIILDFYRKLVRNYHEWGVNLPDGLECESSLNSSYKDSFLRNGAMFQDIRIEANNARGKRIERENGVLRYQLEKEHAGWLARPFAKSESNQPGPGPKQYIPFKQLTEQCYNDIAILNNSPHPVHKEKTRWEYFLENQHKNLKPTNYRAFMRHLGYKTETSCNAGIIKLQYGEYLLGDDGKISTGEDLIRLMKKVESQEFDVYWLDDNYGNVFKAFIYMGDRYICEAIEKPRPNRAKIERTPEHEELMSLMSAYRLTIDTFQKTQKNALEPVAIINRKPQTLNNKFITPGRRKPVEKTPSETNLVFAEEMEEELSYEPQDNQSGSWRNAFNQ